MFYSQRSAHTILDAVALLLANASDDPVWFAKCKHPSYEAITPCASNADAVIDVHESDIDAHVFLLVSTGALKDLANEGLRSRGSLGSRIATCLEGVSPPGWGEPSGPEGASMMGSSADPRPFEDLSFKYEV